MAAGHSPRIFELELDTVPSHDEVLEHTEEFDALLEAGEPCALLFIVPDNPNGATQETIDHMRDWLDRRRPDIEAHCHGIAFVVRSRFLLMAWKPALALKGESFFGCPARAFLRRGDAESWLQDM
jgi:hypothetical protein